MIAIWTIVAFAVAWLAYLWMTYARRPQPIEDWFRQWKYAHRGLHSAERPENSMAAFEAAVESGYGIELDVRLSKDGILYVFHDDNVERMTGESCEFASMTTEQIERLRLKGTSEGIPKLIDVLEMVDGRVPLLVELKNQGFSGTLEREAFRVLERYPGKWAVQSFSPFSMRWFRRNDPEVLRGQLSCRFKGVRGVGLITTINLFLVQHLMTNWLCRPNFISYKVDGLHAPVVKRMRREGLFLLAWTIKSAAEELEVAPFCDTIIFEGFEPVPKMPACDA